MSRINSILEVSVSSTDSSVSKKRVLKENTPDSSRHTLFLDQENTVTMWVKNTSDRQLVFKTDAKIKLSFEMLLSKEEVEEITFETANWKFSIEEYKNNNGKTFFGLEFRPEKEVVLEKGKYLQFKFCVVPAGNPTFSQLSLRFQNIDTVVHTKEYLLLLRTFRLSDEFDLISGIVGDDYLYVSEKSEIQNKFTVFLLNPALNLEIDASTHTSLTLTFGDLKAFKDISLKAYLLENGNYKWREIWDKGKGQGVLELSDTWKEGEIKELRFACEMGKSTDSITSLKIAYTNIPDYNNGAVYVPIKIMTQRQIGSEALSIKMGNDVIQIG
ncbi:MAG: hypothetical protein HRT58_04410 [Crocinitomicaceae bacterium]|nr:hypothetical protein [Flavobacteriales bacterium]NQZ34879.1 hypothetical protein [Crocinitomicaceae bacterium]